MLCSSSRCADTLLAGDPGSGAHMRQRRCALTSSVSLALCLARFPRMVSCQPLLPTSKPQRCTTQQQLPSNRLLAAQQGCDTTGAVHTLSQTVIEKATQPGHVSAHIVSSCWLNRAQTMHKDSLCIVCVRSVCYTIQCTIIQMQHCSKYQPSFTLWELRLPPPSRGCLNPS